MYMGFGKDVRSCEKMAFLEIGFIPSEENREVS
jgi:hypothetical protein